MIKALLVGDTEGSAIALFGLSFENLDRLRQGLPIVVELADMGAARTPLEKVFIFAGETEDGMIEEFKKRGLVAPETVVMDQPAPPDPTRGDADGRET